MKTKFRAWDIRTNTLIAEGFHVIGEVVMFGVIEMYLDKIRKPGETSLELLQYVVVEEFTKTQDRFGADLYEGDFIEALRSKDHRVQKGDKFRIAYDRVHNRWGTVWSGNEDDVKNGEDIDSFIFITPANTKNFKKIGNRYETN